MPCTSRGARSSSIGVKRSGARCSTASETRSRLRLAQFTASQTNSATSGTAASSGISVPTAISSAISSRIADSSPDWYQRPVADFRVKVRQCSPSITRLANPDFSGASGRLGPLSERSSTVPRGSRTWKASLVS